MYCICLRCSFRFSHLVAKCCKTNLFWRHLFVCATCASYSDAVSTMHTD